MSKTTQPTSLGEILKKFDSNRDKYVSREFQKYGYDLAIELNDMSHKSLYIKMAKITPRPILEKARSFVKDANAKNKGSLFMWKVGQLKEEKKKTEKKEKEKSLFD
jgi:mannose-1-phosphate guanylyltransferase